jgi:hypothetical protein
MTDSENKDPILAIPNTATVDAILAKPLRERVEPN